MHKTSLLSIAVVVGLSHPALAQENDFHLTYHVERSPASRLSIETCGSIVTGAARQAGLRSDQTAFPGQLVVVSGGAKGAGTFVAQCIAVGDVTVSVVQGIDYRQQKGLLGRFADQAFAGVKAALK